MPGPGPTPQSSRPPPPQNQQPHRNGTTVECPSLSIVVISVSVVIPAMDADCVDRERMLLVPREAEEVIGPVAGVLVVAGVPVEVFSSGGSPISVSSLAVASPVAVVTGTPSFSVVVTGKIV